MDCRNYAYVFDQWVYDDQKSCDTRAEKEKFRKNTFAAFRKIVKGCIFSDPYPDFTADFRIKSGGKSFRSFAVVR